MDPGEPNELEALSPLTKIVGTVWAAVALLLIFTYWQAPLFLSLASAFRIQLLFVLTALSVPGIILFPGKRKALFVAIPLLLWATFLSYFVPRTNSGNGGETTLAVSNLNAANQDLNRFNTWIRKVDPSVVGLLEVAPRHQRSLEALDFPYSLIEARNGNFGIALLCREEPLRLELVEADSPFPMILAEFSEHFVIAVHPPPPLNSEIRQAGDAQMERLSEWIKGAPKPVVVMGDLNATGWDYRTSLLKEAGLKDGRLGHGLIPTWPVGRRLMQIPIDHILVPEEIEVLSFLSGPPIGSDHLPVTAVVGL